MCFSLSNKNLLQSIYVCCTCSFYHSTIIIYLTKCNVSKKNGKNSLIMQQNLNIIKVFKSVINRDSCQKIYHVKTL